MVNERFNMRVRTAKGGEFELNYTRIDDMPTRIRLGKPYEKLKLNWLPPEDEDDYEDD